MQRKALEPSIELIEAGPGAGKTRTVIERMKQRQSELEKAVALISFTNIAADEAKRRCTRDMLAFPDYVGTLDAFLHRYLVTPSFVLAKGEAPTYLMSWNDLPNEGLVRLREVPGQGMRLGTFKLDVDGNVRIPANTHYSERGYLKSVSQAGHYNKLLRRGHDVIQRLIQNGILDSDAARLEALRILEDDKNTVANRLASRFGEIIIDEFQDCSEIEVRIVRALKKRGIHVVAVADPDQAIYEFRDASPESYGNFRDELPLETILVLENNYRSTPAICVFVSSLRSIGTGRITSSNLTDQGKIVVVGGTANRQREIFREQLVLNGIAEEESITLAHRRRLARRIAGEDLPTQNIEKVTSKTFLILRSIMELTQAKTAKARRDAILRSERTVLALFSWSDNEKRLPPAHQLELADIKRSDIVVFLLELQRDSLNWKDAFEATEAIRNGTTLHFSLKGPTIRSVKQSLVKLKPEHWTHWAQWTDRTKVSIFEATLPNSHIHGVKGQEFRAVMLCAEKPRGGQGFWEMNREDSEEALRVLYVGASRAEELLVLACKPGEISNISEYLRQSEVPFTVAPQ